MATGANRFAPGCDCCGDEENTICDQGAVRFRVCCGTEVYTCPLNACASMKLSTAYVCDSVLYEPEACLTWTSGSDFAGTGDDGSVWAATLGAEDDCGEDNYGRRVDFASVSFDGRTIEWTWNPTRLVYDVATTGWELCTTDCPALSLETAWHARAWNDATRPDTIDVTFANYDESDPCCAFLNDTFTLDFESGSFGDGCLTGSQWVYLGVVDTGVCGLVVVQLIIADLGTSCGAMITLQLSRVFGEATLCTDTWQVSSCQFDCSELALTEADFDVVSSSCCPGGIGDPPVIGISVTLPA